MMIEDGEAIESEELSSLRSFQGVICMQCTSKESLAKVW